MAKADRTKPGTPPIAHHPLFPAVVALWFAALFGLGSLAVRPTLLESLVLNSRIDLLIPAAAPPLGMTARMLLALALAGLGAALGAMIARKVALATPAPQPQRRAAAPAATLDDAPAPRPFARRRALALDPVDDGFVPAEFAPLPGGQPHVLDIAGMALGEPMRPPAEPLDPASALDLASPLDPAASTPLALAESDPAPLDLAGFATAEPAPLPQTPTQPVAERQVFGMAPTADVMAAPPLDLPPGHSCAPTVPVPDDAPLPDLALRLRGALEARRAARLAPVALPDQLPEQLPDQPPVHPAEAEAPAVAPAAAAAPAAAPTGASWPVGLGLPAALRPLDLADAAPDEDDLALPRRLALPPTGQAAATAPLADLPLAKLGDVPLAAFGAVGQGAGRAVAPEPVVIFPGQVGGDGALAPFAAPAPVAEPAAPWRRFDAPDQAGSGQPTLADGPVLPAADPAETERALRAALASLQRISGAA